MVLLKRSLVVVLLSFAWPALAQEPSPLPSRLVNLDTPAITSKGLLGGRVDIRFLPEPESITYSSIGARYGVFDHLEVGVRASTGATRDFAVPGGGVIRHGGQDVELYGTYGLNLADRISLAGLVGVGFPHTPAQDQATVSLGGMASFRANDRVTLVLNPRATLQDSNVTVGIGLGAHVRLSQGLAIMGDWTGMASGENTRSTSDGSRIKRDVWGVALQWSSIAEGTEYAIDLGCGNSIGTTTGFSLTPGLGHATGFYLALIARR